MWLVPDFDAIHQVSWDPNHLEVTQGILHLHFPQHMVLKQQYLAMEG
jgi:hypothetical protein